MTVTLAACGDSTAPNANLSEEQIADMLDAMSAVGAFSVGSPAANVHAPSNAAIANAMANAMASVSETVECPQGGTASLTGTANGTENQATMQVKLDWNACKGTSSSGRLWTFDGDPNITLNATITNNPTTGAFSMTATERGGIRFASDIGEGHCSVDLTLSISSNGDTATASISGQVCGKPVTQSMN
ncbi:MAG TPA: hypothetical protein VFT29_13785 [Gemmatimonadaceae bacterium]|nr:hypothetical protein [Gemmatimonadaceae bacterium]